MLSPHFEERLLGSLTIGYSSWRWILRWVMAVPLLNDMTVRKLGWEVTTSRS